MYFAGVDGGATKTQVIIGDAQGNILGLGKSGSSYLRRQKEDSLIQVWEEAFTQALVDAGLKPGLRISKSCFGLAGLDTPDDFGMARKALGKIKVVKLDLNPLVVNDVVCALRRGSDKGFGVAVVAGTGSNCYAKSRFGSEAYTSGLGEMLSDEGSSYEVGQKVLHAAAKSFDGRGPKSLLEEMLCEYFGAANLRDVVLKVHLPNFGKTQIAELAPLCDDASEKGDPQAQAILIQAGKELALMVKAAVEKLHMSQEIFDLVCIGGSFKRPHGLIRVTFEKEIKKITPKANLIFPINEPAMGALWLALDKFRKGKL